MAVKFKYCRIQGKELAANTKTGKGIFSMFNQMLTDGVMDEEDKALYHAMVLDVADQWIAKEQQQGVLSAQASQYPRA